MCWLNSSSSNYILCLKFPCSSSSICFTSWFVVLLCSVKQLTFFYSVNRYILDASLACDHSPALLKRLRVKPVVQAKVAAEPQKLGEQMLEAALCSPQKFCVNVQHTSRRALRPRTPPQRPSCIRNPYGACPAIQETRSGGEERVGHGKPGGSS